MKITEVYIDGFKNVRNTCLNFSKEPIIILIAPNNYGKTNLLQGIQEGFNLIRKQGTEVVDYIRDRSYIDKFEKYKVPPFTFGVKFFKHKEKRLYHYTFSINYDDKLNGITRELLEFIDNPADNDMNIPNQLPKGANTLFIRDEQELSTAKIKLEDTEEIANIKHSSNDAPNSTNESEKLYPSNHYLFLHKLGNMAIIGTESKASLVKALKEIAGVLTSLTRENIGTIIADEDSKYRVPMQLARDARKLKDENIAEFEEFEKSFCKMFPQYKKLDIISISENHHELLFKGKHKTETVATLSYGTRRTFKLLSQVYANKTPLISLEELEVGLHPSLYQNTLNTFFSSLNEEKYKQRNKNTPEDEKRKNEPRLIISSHAPV